MALQIGELSQEQVDEINKIMSLVQECLVLNEVSGQAGLNALLNLCFSFFRAAGYKQEDIIKLSHMLTDWSVVSIPEIKTID